MFTFAINQTLYLIWGDIVKSTYSCFSWPSQSWLITGGQAVILNSITLLCYTMIQLYSYWKLFLPPLHHREWIIQE